MRWPCHPLPTLYSSPVQQTSSVGGGKFSVKQVGEGKWEGGGRVCYVVFSQQEEVEQALMMCDSGEEVRCEVGRVGVGKWCEEYAVLRPRLDLVEKTVEKYIGEVVMSEGWSVISSELQYCREI